MSKRMVILISNIVELDGVSDFNAFESDALDGEMGL